MVKLENAAVCSTSPAAVWLFSLFVPQGSGSSDSESSHFFTKYGYITFAEQHLALGLFPFASRDQYQSVDLAWQLVAHSYEF